LDPLGLPPVPLRGAGKLSAVIGLHVIACNLVRLVRLVNLLDPVIAA
jgi:hypothetical protein